MDKIIQNFTVQITTVAVINFHHHSNVVKTRSIQNKVMPNLDYTAG